MKKEGKEKTLIPTIKNLAEQYARKNSSETIYSEHILYAILQVGVTANTFLKQNDISREEIMSKLEKQVEIYEKPNPQKKIEYAKSAKEILQGAERIATRLNQELKSAHFIYPYFENFSILTHFFNLMHIKDTNFKDKILEYLQN